MKAKMPWSMTRRELLRYAMGVGPAFLLAGHPFCARAHAGALQRMQNEACTDFRGVHMIDGAGHWVQQEKPDETARHLLDFLSGTEWLLTPGQD